MKKIILLIILLFVLPMSLALNFNVACDPAQANTAFDCRITLADSQTQLKGLSFNINAGTATVNSVTFASSLTDVSVPPTYGFFTLSTPFTGSGTLATINLQPAAGFNLANLAITGVRGELGSGTVLQPNELIFQTTTVSLTSACSTANPCQNSEECIAGHCKPTAAVNSLSTEIANILTDNQHYPKLLQKISAIAKALRVFFA